MDHDDAITALRDRLRRHPPDRYPVQHATTQFHLGQALLQAGAAGPAAEALRAAVDLFDPAALPVEHAKALNLLGAASRDLGRLPGASDSFRRAAALFRQRDRPLEHAAALFNLGLTTREGGDAAAAVDCFTQARGGFKAANLPAQEAAAARELGGTLLGTGQLDAAAAAFEDAVELAGRAGDRPGVGTAANSLGLTYLAAGRWGDAIEALRVAVAAHPRSVRPGAAAMAKANLALAYERTGLHARARLAAAQALGTPQAAPPVRSQAGEVLQRLGHDSADLLTVLDDEPQTGWPVVFREELDRWLDAHPESRRAAVTALVEGQASRASGGVELAEAWLGVLLELPPAAMEALVGAVVEAWATRDAATRERFQGQVARALPRFAMPQWLRLRDTFDRLTVALGGGRWG